MPRGCPVVGALESLQIFVRHRIGPSTQRPPFSEDFALSALRHTSQSNNGDGRRFSIMKSR